MSNQIKWSGSLDQGFTASSGNMSLYMKARGNKYAGIVLDAERQQVGGGWFVATDSAIVEAELLGRINANNINASGGIANIEKIFDVTPQLLEQSSQITNLLCDVCRVKINTTIANQSLCQKCYDKYEIPIYNYDCIICKCANPLPENIKYTYIDTAKGFSICTTCWKDIYTIKNNLEKTECLKCGQQFQPCNYYEYYLGLCALPNDNCVAE